MIPQPKPDAEEVCRSLRDFQLPIYGGRDYSAPFASGSSAPLGWAHAEYLQLLGMIAQAGFPDVVQPARRQTLFLGRHQFTAASSNPPLLIASRSRTPDHV